MKKRNMYIDNANEDWADRFDKATRLPAILLTLSVLIEVLYSPCVNWLNYESTSRTAIIISVIFLGGMVCWRLFFDNIFGLIWAKILICISLLMSSNSVMTTINEKGLSSISAFDLSIVLVPAICIFLALFFCQWLFDCEQKFTRENGTVEQRFCVSNI